MPRLADFVPFAPNGMAFRTETKPEGFSVGGVLPVGDIFIRNRLCVTVHRKVFVSRSALCWEIFSMSLMAYGVLRGKWLALPRQSLIF